MEKYVISPIDNKQYCRKNGQFRRHLIQHGFATYQQFFEAYYPTKIQRCCICEKVSAFNQYKMTYKPTCGNKICANQLSSLKKKQRSQSDWSTQTAKFHQSMSSKSIDELAEVQRQRMQTATVNGSYKASVVKREYTCQLRYGHKQYNNSSQISQSKLDWSEERKQLFLRRLKIALNGRWLSDYTTGDTWIKRRITLEQQGRATPLHLCSSWHLYKRKVKLLTEKTYKRHTLTINPNNYKRTLAGVHDGYHLDHIIPIYYGFVNRVPEEEISHIDNLQMLPWRTNLQKGIKYEPTNSI